MSKYTAERAYRMLNEDDDLVICYVVHGVNKYPANMSLRECQTDKQLDVEVKPHKSNRSLEQNKMLWALLGKMAKGMSGSKRKVEVDECYRIILEEANISYDFLLALPETEPKLRECFRVVRKIDEREINGKTLNMYQCFIGSSKFNVAEMTELIEITLDKLSEMGIEDSEIELARMEYKR